MNTLDKAAADLSGRFLSVLWVQYDRLVAKAKRKPESKIEEALLLALIGFSICIGYFYFSDDRPVDGSYQKALEDGRPWYAEVDIQPDVLKYRVDFLVTVYNGADRVRKIVIECDGHEFHDRTKEQAARDRSRDRDITAAGYTVLRFTGSEIYQDAALCASQIMKVVRAAIHGVEGQ